MISPKMKCWHVSVWCYVLEKQLHFKLSAESREEALYLASAVNNGIHVFVMEVPDGYKTANKELIAYAQGNIYAMLPFVAYQNDNPCMKVGN